MNGLPYYKRYPRDFIEGTQGMPFELKGAYSLLLDLIYIQSGHLPDDPRYIAGLLGVSVRKWKGIREALIDAGKLAVTGGCLTNYRALIELESLSKFQDKQSQNRSRPNKNNNLKSRRSNHTEPDTNNPPNPPNGGPDNLEFLGVPERVAHSQAEAIRNCVEWQTRHLSANQARALVGAGLVTEEQCHKAGVL